MSPNFEETAYEQLVKDGIIALKNGEMEKARRMMEKATQYNRPDARPWMALAETTDNPAEKRKYVECAVSADPFNSLARRAMVEFSDQFDRERVLPQGEGVTPEISPPPEEALSNETDCPNCGGRLSFNPQSTCLICEYCGYSALVAVRAAADEGEQTLELTLPTTRAHLWSQAQEQLQCGKCGAVSLLAPGQKSSRCSYCGSNQLVSAPSAQELVDPQGIGLMRIDSSQALMAVRKWLGKGALAPDDLHHKAARFHLRPAYYPFWTFDGILEAAWSCQVNVGTSRAPRWESRSGTEMEMFDDVLVHGLKSLSKHPIEAIHPFALKDVVAFEPHLLAGWTALGYDRTLADASLDARQFIMNKVRDELDSRVEPGREKRNLSTGGGKWAALTYKHILLPLWIGSYTYAGKMFDIVVNGQTGKVAGSKPKDSLKIWLIILIVVLLVLTIAMGAALMIPKL